MLGTLEAPTRSIEVEADHNLTGRNAKRENGRFYVSPEILEAINSLEGDDLAGLLDSVYVDDLDGAAALEHHAELCLN